MSALYANPTWLWAVTGSGLAIIGREAELELPLELPYVARRRAIELLWEGCDAHSLAEATEASSSDAEALLGDLEARGGLLPASSPPPPSTGTALARAILSAERGEQVPSLVWTADEALVLPPRLDATTARHALRMFVAGITPYARLAAYGYLARWLVPSLEGDLPSAEDTHAAAGELGRSPAIVTVDFRNGHREEIEPAELDRLGVTRTRRLGTLQALLTSRGDGGSFAATARYAAPNIAHPGARTARRTWGNGQTAEHAELGARGEAAERYAVGDLAPHHLMRARARELVGALEPDWLFVINDRQREGAPLVEPYDPEAEYMWVAGQTAQGKPRWVAADGVFTSFADPSRRRPVMPATTSGVAAWSSQEGAKRHACCELIERDAFIWTWVQGVSRELIDVASLPAELRRRIASIEATGWTAALVNLTLETVPVIMCALLGPATTYGPERMILGLACHPDPYEGAAHAFDEAALIRSVKGAEPPKQIEVEDVCSPEDHLALVQLAEGVRQAEFLVSSEQRMRIGDVSGAEEPVDALERLCGDVVFVDLTSPASRPFEVTRAFAPGLVPLTFGYDGEALALPRLAEVKQTADGRTVGRALDLARHGPIMPHPFP